MTDELNDIDFLMNLDPETELSTEKGSIGRKRLDAIIAYHRNQRAMKESPGGFKKAVKDQGPKQVLDLEKLGLKPAAGPKINRRI